MDGSSSERWMRRVLEQDETARSLARGRRREPQIEPNRWKIGTGGLEMRRPVVRMKNGRPIAARASHGRLYPQSAKLVAVWIGQSRHGGPLAGVDRRRLRF